MIFLEKRNLGIPITLLLFLSYLIGYSFSNNVYGFIPAIIFGVIIFLFDFDERVTIAVKQSFFIGFLILMIHLALNIIGQLNELSNFWSTLNSVALSKIYQVGNSVVEILTTLIYIIFIVLAILNRDIRIKSILLLLTNEQGEIAAPINKVLNTNTSREQIPNQQKVDNQESNKQEGSKWRGQGKHQYSKTNKLFPPNQQQYPPMPHVEPPAKSDPGKLMEEKLIAEMDNEQIEETQSVDTVSDVKQSDEVQPDEAQYEETPSEEAPTEEDS